MKRTMLIAGALLLCLPKTAFALCEKKTTIADLARVGQEGEDAFAQMSLERLLSVSVRAREVILTCLGEKLTPRDAAAFHRLMALEAFTNRQRDRVVAEFHAARKLDPGYEIPKEVAPEDHQLHKLYDKALNEEDGILEMVYPPEGGFITVGGVRNAPRSSKTPVIIQVFDVSKNIIETRYLQPGQTTPQWGVNPLGLTAKDLVVGRSALVEPKTWYVSAAVTAVVAGVFYGVALYNKAQFTDTSGHDTVDSDRKLADYQSRANGFGTVSITTGALGVVFVGIGVGFHLFDQKEKSQQEGDAHGRSTDDR